MKTLLVSALTVLLVARTADACTSDADCKGDRVCDEGKCTAPKPKAKTPPKKPKEPEPREESPPPPKVESTEPSSSPWRGAPAPVKVALGLVVGESIRAADSVYYGTGFGVQVGYTNTSGFYLGAYWHEHLRNEKHASDYDALLGRIETTVKGRTSYYLLEIGSHTNVNAWLNLRWVTGLGLAHYTGDGSVRFPDAAVAPITTTVNDWAFVLQPKAAALFRPTPGFYLGPQLGMTLAVKDGDFGVGAYESHAIVGWVL